MRVLVVQAHPRHESFNAAILDQVTKVLASRHAVDVIRLYDDGFDPRMTPAERIAYHTPNPIISDQVERYTNLVTGAEVLVFVYPTWWFGLPAILKGWLDRVLVPGVAFVFDRSNKVKPNLLNVKRIVGITTYGSSWMYCKLFNDAGRRTLVRTLRLVCNPATRATWLGLYGIDWSSPARRHAFLKRVERTLTNL
ncbi:MAG: NAD(P)H-dependent oxidoreductase [Actinomycetota bacterium]